MGFTNTVKGGALKIAGASVPAQPRAIEGTAHVGAFEVKDLPALVMLLNAISPFGFADMFSGKMSFDHLRGRFHWEGDTVQLIDVNAPASSAGLNVEGKIDMNSGDAKLHGTMAPFSMVNKIIGSIPSIGDVMTGGKGGGVLAVAYDITGPLANPKVSVDPVSLLTPGFLRNLFFSGKDDDETPPAEAPPAAPPSRAISINNVIK